LRFVSQPGCHPLVFCRANDLPLVSKKGVPRLDLIYSCMEAVGTSFTQLPFIGKYLSCLGHLDDIIAPPERFETQL
jgi:hypothetical protein